MPEIEGGAVFWARQTVDSEIFFKQPAKWFKIWFYMVAKAHWQDRRGLRRGQCHLKYEWIMDATGANRDEVSNCIRWLKRTKQITTQKTTRGLVLTICNYNKYQDPGRYKNETKNDNKNETGTTQERHRNDTILKKGNKENKTTGGKSSTFKPPKPKEVIAYFKAKGYPKELALKAYDYYNTANWHDSRGNKVKNWKQKMIANWFKDDPKQDSSESGPQACRNCGRTNWVSLNDRGQCEVCQKGE